jgi:endonuclease/exonuclease/phosphatase family metal-dependent hydrolase
MGNTLLTRRRTVLEQEVEEPTLFALLLAIIGFILLLGVCLLGIVFLPAFGYLGWIFAGVAILWVWLLVGLRRQRGPGPMAATGRQRVWRWITRGARWLFFGLFTGWLGLMAWSVLCSAGPAPPPKADPADIRVVTWNIHCGQDEGPPWKQFDWPVRKHALRTAVEQAQPDILCVQEATPQQVAFLEETLPGHRRVGIGRDGPAGGEHCAIYFSRQRFEEMGSNTFWLEEPIDQPRPGSALDVKRICTWVRLRDQKTSRTLRIYNTHLYLTEAPRMTAVQVILPQIAAGDPADAVLLTADFNAAPNVASRRLFTEAKLMDSAELASSPVRQPTFQLYGIGMERLDAILIDSRWRVHNHLILKVKPGNTFPSDHFGVLADLAFTEDGSTPR